MAFGINRQELRNWKKQVEAGEIAFLTHYWLDERFPDCTTVTKVGCQDIHKLQAWGRNYHLSPQWIDQKDNYPHFDLFGEKQRFILNKEQQWEQINRFQLY
ncbi:MULTISPECIES: hypothetical protein [Virgibacillus]|uniref:YneQ n=2 Tax=Virgibacillus TaxID=84406 RepID=A0A024QBI9_9BACI|nr:MULTISPECIES: hypothetical protein [Virgibacillus]EQB36203.1 hypothetical protein M948_14305 [Virgibacillus sp. CM-4]MYL42075.1 hypothetical protein [Virgibacillus massiliensis]GGJ45787.1 hypothetical protein GCM10007111_04740 [Virgibacillus kapii]CDQ39903.1 hypothetical protein BN990_02220 [Virgibacillus massiliensis]